MNEAEFILTLIWVGFLGVCSFFWGGGGGGKITPSLKLVRILLETWNLVRKCVSTHTYKVLENTSFSTKVLLILLMWAFFWESSTFTESNSVRFLLEIV